MQYMYPRKVPKLNRQSVWDLAVQEYGSIDGAFKILRDNAELSLDATIPDGFLVLITEPPLNKDVVNKLIEKGIKPANEYIAPLN